MDILTAINSRASALKLIEPAPSRADLETIMLAGARAPDHGKLAPWRFAVLVGEARNILATAMAQSLQRRVPDATSAHIDGERQKPLRAPAIIAVAAHVTRQHKVPEHEQIMAVAAAVENMFLAAQHLGFGAMWKTGVAAEDSLVKAALGFEVDDHIVAFLYLGTNALPGPIRTVTLNDKVRWL